MRWSLGRVLSPLLLAIGIVFLGLHWIGQGISRLFDLIAKVCNRIGRGISKLCSRIGRGISRLFGLIAKVCSRIARVFGVGGNFVGAIGEETRRFRHEGRRVARDVAAFSAEQQVATPLSPDKQTVFLLITCGQAVRNFMLSDVLALMRAKFNVVILSPYAYSERFRDEYRLPGVHVLPWFESFRTVMERAYQYYFMGRSRSRTHHSWLANLEARAKSDAGRRFRFKALVLMRRASDLLGGLVGPRGMQGLYGSYFMSYLPKRLFTFLLTTYRPALVISTTAHHAEAWPLTFFARRNGIKTLANILSWDNTSTKTLMDVCCHYYTVWSEEMGAELSYQFPHIKSEVVVTGSPLFDMYFNKTYAMPREAFMADVGLPPSKPYILYTTNTPAAMPDEPEVVRQYWEALNRSSVGGRIGLLVRLHPKESIDRYESLLNRKDLVVTQAARPHWTQSDRWLPSHDDMKLLMNSMLHAAVSVNVASTMSLESFALGLPTINVAFKSSADFKDHGSMWSFDMYHFSEHYHALVDNGAVELARNVEELVSMTINALEHGSERKDAMRRTLAQKAAYSDGTSAQRFVDVIERIVLRAAARRKAPVRVAEIEPVVSKSCVAAHDVRPVLQRLMPFGPVQVDRHGTS